MTFMLDCTVWLVSEFCSWSHCLGNAEQQEWLQQCESGDGVIICWNAGMSYTSQRILVMFSFFTSNGPKIFKCWPINIGSVMLVVQVMDSISKTLVLVMLLNMYMIRFGNLYLSIAQRTKICAFLTCLKSISIGSLGSHRASW